MQRHLALLNGAEQRAPARLWSRFELAQLQHWRGGQTAAILFAEMALSGFPEAPDAVLARECFLLAARDMLGSREYPLATAVMLQGALAALDPDGRGLDTNPVAAQQIVLALLEVMPRVILFHRQDASSPHWSPTLSGLAGERATSAQVAELVALCLEVAGDE